MCRGGSHLGAGVGRDRGLVSPCHLQLLLGIPVTALWPLQSRPETNFSSWVRNVGVRAAGAPPGPGEGGLGSPQALPGPLPAPLLPTAGATYPSTCSVAGPDLVSCPRGHILGNCPLGNRTGPALRAVPA